MSLCWLSDDVLATMEPVIKFNKDHAEHEGVPEDAPHGAGPGFVGTPPNRPHGKTASAEADALGEAAEDAEAVSRARRHEVRDEISETGGPATDDNATSAPFTPRALGEGRQAENARVAPAVGGASADGSVGNRPAGIARPDQPDDLKLISGVGPKIEAILNELGIYRFEQVAAWNKAERDWVDHHIQFHGRIERDDWVGQAKALAEGGEAEYIRVFGKKPR